VKAALLTAIDAPLEIVDLQIDDPGPQEVRIRTAAAGVCHSDLHAIEGKYPCALPSVLGHEAAGVVEAVGSAVEYVQAGDHVITCISMWCGNCRNCILGQPSLCSQEGLTRQETDKPRLTWDGAPVNQFSNLSCYAEGMLVHEKAVVKVTKDIPLEKAALIGCGVVTGIGAAQNTAQVRPGQVVAVVGCGGIGLNAVQGARLAGAERIIAIDRLASKLELARKFGATDVVDASKVDPVEAVRDLTGGGVDHAIEAIGLKMTVEQCFSMIAMGGTATVIGMLPIGTKIELMGLELLAAKKIQGCVMGSTRFRIDIPSYIQLYLQGRLNLDDLVSRVIKLEEINEAFDALKTGEVARSVIRMGA